VVKLIGHVTVAYCATKRTAHYFSFAKQNVFMKWKLKLVTRKVSAMGNICVRKPLGNFLAFKS